jgi:VIT1/CCC1 family predicted Fe2+/Mn2+ transporter
MQALDEKTKRIVLEFQKNEITEHFVYKRLSRLVRNEHNSEVMRKISEEELRHYNIWKRYSEKEVRPDSFRYYFYTIISMVFGVTFGIKLMERAESNAQVSYNAISNVVPEAEEIRREEEEHENALVNMINEEKLKYLGSMVLGLNDALVEFTGALAGFTFALQNSRLIGMVGLIMGISASFSMAASEYLSTKTESDNKHPGKASFYTGMAYILTVAVLVFPYFFFHNHYLSLLATIGLAVLLILIFTFYSSVVKELVFKERFMEMLVISMSVAALSFVIGLIVKKVMRVDI